MTWYLFAAAVGAVVAATVAALVLRRRPRSADPAKTEAALNEALSRGRAAAVKTAEAEARKTADARGNALLARLNAYIDRARKP